MVLLFKHETLFLLVLHKKLAVALDILSLHVLVTTFFFFARHPMISMMYYPGFNLITTAFTVDIVIGNSIDRDLTT